MKQVPGLYGLVMCGGNSSRMGTDKSLLQYHALPQRYHLYHMLQRYCEKVVISCNESQASDMQPGYDFLTDKPAYQDIGPLAGLLTAFDHYPKKNYLVIGCDYPLLKREEMDIFITHIEEGKPMAFYNQAAKLFEPLLAFYPTGIFPTLVKMYEQHQFSLQHALKENNAQKYLVADSNSLLSIDTHEQYFHTKAALHELR